MSDDQKIATATSSTAAVAVAAEDDDGRGQRQTYHQYLLQRRYRLETLASSSKTKVDQSFVETTARNKNIDSIRFLSCGPHSYVFIGRHLSSGKTIAVKALLKDDLEKAGSFIMKRNLPYNQLYTDDRIAKVYEIFPSGKILFILSDFHKTNLAQVLIDNRGPLREDLVRDIFLGVVNALNHMHTNKIAHRNLKLENILLGENHRPLISDYNYTIVVENVENFNRILAHSMPYLAPEILDRLPYDPIVADVWSLGICLYTVLHNAFPFVPSVKSSPSTLSFSENTAGSELSVEAKNCLRFMLQVDVNKRAKSSTLVENIWFVL